MTNTCKTTSNYPENTGPAGYINKVHNLFIRAKLDTGSSRERYYSIANRVIRLDFAGEALAPKLTPALAHLASGPSNNLSLTVCLWDKTSAHFELPPTPWHFEDCCKAQKIMVYNNDHLSMVFNTNDQAFSMLDSSANLAVFHVPDARTIPYYESGAPLRLVFNWWAGKHDLQMVHAAAVGTASGGVLLVGKGGSGKSTTALTCLHAGMNYAGDDYVLVSASPSPSVHSIYNSAKINADNLGRLPFLREVVSNADKLASEKALVYLHKYHPERVKKSFPLKAVLLPCVTGGQSSRLKKTSPSQALAALAPSTIFQLPGSGTKALRTMARLVETLPCYVLELGSDLRMIPRVITELLLKL